MLMHVIRQRPRDAGAHSLWMEIEAKIANAVNYVVGTLDEVLPRPKRQTERSQLTPVLSNPLLYLFLP